jgi:DNA-directed RNA polymerase subunit RPC12/RpoP
MPDPDPLKDAEVEIVCTRCQYRLARTPDRLRRGLALVCPQCGQQIVATDGPASPGGKPGSGVGRKPA